MENHAGHIHASLTAKWLTRRDTGLLNFCFDPTIPYIITVDFHVNDGMQTWEIGRDLLYMGTSVAAGLMDIHVVPQGRDTIIRIGYERQEVFAVDRKELQEFIVRTFQAVPRDQEIRSKDVDLLLEKLLS